MSLWIALLAEGSATQPNPVGQWFSFFAAVLPAMLIWYLLFMRPQMRKDKERQQAIANLKKNDRVLTTGGIYGVVRFVDDKEVLLRVDDENKVDIRFAKSAVIGVVRPDDRGGESK